MSINNITGSPVEGENFFGREKELDFAWKSIKKGNSTILSAPRRVGKSSFAKKLLTFAKNEGWNTLEINLEEIKSEEGFVKLFIEKLQEESWWETTKSKTGGVITQLLESIKPSFEYEGTKASLEWKSKKIDIYSQLKTLLDHQKETLIMVDEVTILLNSFIKNDKENGIRDVEFFLNWLRSFRQTSGTKIRWIFCSSIGIDNFTNRYALSHTFNDVKTFPIGAFEPEKAKHLIFSLAESDNLELSNEIVEQFLGKIKWHLPYFVQILYSNFQSAVEIYDYPNDLSTLDYAYNELIESKELNTWDERLGEYGEFELYARLILKYLCKNPTGENRDNLFNILYAKINDEDKAETVLNKLLYMLQNDGYLVDNEDIKYVFRSPLLRDFWFNRFAK
jgi:uncharacterized protein